MISKFAKLRSVMGNGIIVPRCTSVPRGSKTAMHPESAKVYFEKYKQDPKRAAMMVKKGKFNNARISKNVRPNVIMTLVIMYHPSMIPKGLISEEPWKTSFNTSFMKRVFSASLMLLMVPTNYHLGALHLEKY